jgi:hypothetical protein
MLKAQGMPFFYLALANSEEDQRNKGVAKFI